jgi:DNA primase
LLYQVEREDFSGGKKIRQRQPDGKGGWIWNLAGVTAVPYRLPELLEALAQDRTVVIAEGEAKVDLLWSWNIPATCNSGGAGKWRAQHSAYLRGADVVILPDNDEPGRQHASTVAASLKEAGAIVRVLDLPTLGEKGDIIDWAGWGGTREQLDDLIENAARPWTAEARPNDGRSPANHRLRVDAHRANVNIAMTSVESAVIAASFV